MDLKLGKYYKKILLTDNIEKYNTYKDKIKKYNKKEKQVGGSNMDIPSYVNDIVNNNYRLLTDLKLITDISYELEQCKDDFFGDFEPIDTIEYKDGYRFNCFMRKVGMSTDESSVKESGYSFKKNFSLAFTDIYMQKGLQKNDLIVSTNYIYYIMKYTLDTYIETVIKNNKFDNKTIHLYKNINLLYKGGNTTRLIFNSFIKSSKAQLSKNKSKNVLNSIQNLDELIDNYNVGDWDYYIKINFIDLRKNGFTDEELVKVTNQISQVFIYTASIIKNKIAVLLNSSLNIKNITESIQKFVFSDEIKSNIAKFLEIYNKSEFTLQNISHAEVIQVYTHDKLIEKDNIKTLNRDSEDFIKRNSFILKNTDKIEGNEERGYGPMNYYVEVDSQLIDTVSENIIPESLIKDDVYIAYMSNIGFARRYPISSFNLVRIKVNNTIVLKIDKNDGIQRTKNLRVNMELVDISIPSIYDAKEIFYYHYRYPNFEEFLKCKINNPLFKNDQIYISLPSSYAMFSDVCHLLFSENLFVWEDPKYAKRIKRLFFLSLPCLYQDSIQTNEIINFYSQMKELFEKSYGKTNIKDRLDLLANSYDIVTSPYNDLINGQLKNNVTELFMNLNIIHRIVKLKYANLRYLEFIIANYIKMLIVANYIINNTAENIDQYELIHYELQIHRILELKNVYDYIKPSISITGLTKPLNNIYDEVRGGGHNLMNNNLVPIGKLNSLGSYDQNKVNDFMELLKKYELTIINQCEFILVILKGFKEAGLQNINTVYESDSLF